MKDNNCLNIFGWMINQLKLTGNELLVYAVIYGFSQDGKSAFTGSGQYLADATGVSRRSIVTTLDKLVKKGFLEKHCNTENGVKHCQYKALKVGS